MIVFVIVFLIGAFGMNFPIFSSTMAVEFGRGAGEYGLLSSILAIGSLTGALLAARRERARIRVIILATAFFGVATLIAALMPTFWTFAASTILIGLGAVTILTTANGYVQTTTEPALRGRVMALYMAILVGGTPIGAPIVGAVADGLGPRWALGIAAVTAAVAALIGVGWLVFSRGMRVARHPQSAWRPIVRFADAPTAALSAIETQSVPVVGSAAAIANERLVPADFSEEVALTSPIPLPKLSARASERLASERLASERHTPDRHTPERHTPDRRTPEHHTPDRRTPEHHTPERRRHGRLSSAGPALARCRKPSEYAARTDDLRHFTEHAARLTARSRRARASRRRRG